MQTLEIKTLIDITNTGVKRPNQGTIQELDQYKNWITLNQCIEMRGNISYDSEPYSDVVDLKNFGFGKHYKGQHRVCGFGDLLQIAAMYLTPTITL